VPDKQQPTSLLTLITRNDKSAEKLNRTSKHDSSLPFFNNSMNTSGRLNQTTIHHHGAAAATARSLRREKVREGSVKSTSKDSDPTNSHHIFQQYNHHHHQSHNTTASPTVPNSHLYSRPKTFLTGITHDSFNKSSLFPLKPSGKFNSD